MSDELHKIDREITQLEQKRKVMEKRREALREKEQQELEMMARFEQRFSENDWISYENNGKIIDLGYGGLNIRYFIEDGRDMDADVDSLIQRFLDRKLLLDCIEWLSHRISNKVAVINSDNICIIYTEKGKFNVEVWRNYFCVTYQPSDDRKDYEIVEQSYTSDPSLIINLLNTEDMDEVIDFLTNSIAQRYIQFKL